MRSESLPKTKGYDGDQVRLRRLWLTDGGLQQQAVQTDVMLGRAGSASAQTRPTLPSELAAQRRDATC